MLEGNCHGLKKKLRRVLGHRGAGEMLQVVVLNTVVRVGIIKVISKRKGN